MNDFINNLNNPQDVNFNVFLFNLLLAFLYSIIISFYYNKFSNTLSNKDIFSNNFTIIICTTTLIIFIVKNSLAQPKKQY